MNHIRTLLVCCPDQKGLVAALAQVLYGHGANIVHADQHTDPIAAQFFQRIQYDISELRTDEKSLEVAISEVASRFDMRWKVSNQAVRKRAGIFVSKYNHCLYDLLLRHKAGELVCDIPVIVSNHPDLRAVAEHFEVPFYCVPVKKGGKEAAEATQLELVQRYDLNLLVLARYMQILSDDFLSKCPGPVINIHHSFLPAFVGSKPYHRAYERGVKLIGATAHYATPDLDEGPIIEQGVTRVSHRDSVSDLIRKGRDLEKLVLAKAVRWHLEDRLLVYENKTIVFN